MGGYYGSDNICGQGTPGLKLEGQSPIHDEAYSNVDRINPSGHQACGDDPAQVPLRNDIDRTTDLRLGLRSIDSIECSMPKETIDNYGNERELARLYVASDMDSNTDWQLVKGMADGNWREFGARLKELSGDKGKLEDAVENLNKVMIENGCTCNVHYTADGRVLLSDQKSDHALIFDPSTGRASPRTIEHSGDDTISVKTNDLLVSNNDNLFGRMAGSFVTGILVSHGARTIGGWGCASGGGRGHAPEQTSDGIAIDAPVVEDHTQSSPPSWPGLHIAPWYEKLDRRDRHEVYDLLIEKK